MGIENKPKPDFSKALETHERIIRSELFLYGGDPRGVGPVYRRGGRTPSAPPEPKREYSYDDPDYMPGHGPGYTIHINRENYEMTVEDGPFLHGPELPPGFERNVQQHTNLGSLATDAALLADIEP